MIEIMVYGSCVSRDLVAIHKKSLECVDYVARQAWISAASEGLDPILETELSSKFQNEMLAGDFKSDAYQRISQHIESCDLLLLDIIDDRFGVYPLDGSYVTPSAEFSVSGVRHQLQLGDHIPFGSDQHFDLWVEGAQALKETIGDYMGKCFVLGARYTDVSLDGTVVPDALARKSSDWNQLYDRYYDALVAMGFNVIRLPAKMAVTTKYHQWGVAPFHYVEGAYGWWLEQILKSKPELAAK